MKYSGANKLGNKLVLTFELVDGDPDTPGLTFDVDRTVFAFSHLNDGAYMITDANLFVEMGLKSTEVLDALGIVMPHEDPDEEDEGPYSRPECFFRLDVDGMRYVQMPLYQLPIHALLPGETLDKRRLNILVHKGQRVTVTVKTASGKTAPGVYVQVFMRELRIRAAAIQVEDGRVTQGFVTECGLFYGRKAAGAIAVSAGQIDKVKQPHVGLCSEELEDGKAADGPEGPKA